MSLKSRAKELKRLSLTVYFAARDPRTPLMVRALAVLVAAYALSPIDLIPDFIPVVGLLDDLILIPLGIALIVRLTPSEILVSAQAKAERSDRQPISYTAAASILAAWILMIWMFVSWLFHAPRV